LIEGEFDIEIEGEMAEIWSREAVGWILHMVYGA
jgi:acyl carrier protein